MKFEEIYSLIKEGETLNEVKKPNLSVDKLNTLKFHFESLVTEWGKYVTADEVLNSGPGPDGRNKVEKLGVLASRIKESGKYIVKLMKGWGVA